MAPLICDPLEIKIFKDIIHDVFKYHQITENKANIKIGSMIETPRALILMEEIAEHSDFLSFGTNDLSQFIWASSRDYSETSFLNKPPYKFMEFSPFSMFDTKGVGKMMKESIELVRSHKKIPIGVCGEHVKDENAIDFFNSIGIDYVSCTPNSIPEVQFAILKSQIANKT